MRAPLLITALLLLATAPLALAADRCTPAVADRLEPLDLLPGLPGTWVPFVAYDDSRLPAIPSVVASGPGGLCAVSGDLAAFARAAGVVSDEDRARLAIAASYPDQLGVPQVEVLSIDGGVATATTWSLKDGVVADWTVDLATLQADFVVRAVGVGHHEATVEGWHVWPGLTSQTLRDLENGALVTKVLMQPLPDGAAFRLTYFTQFYASEAQADQYAADYAAASLTVWTIQNQEWGFTSADADRIYDIRMDGCSCISAGNNVNIRVHAKLEDLLTLFNPPLQYPTFQHFYRIVIGHEWHHHLQYSINQWRLGNALTEGGARFSETVFEPEGAFGPNTIQTLPNSNGFANMMLNPNVAPASRTYDLGLLWGFLYGTNGGIPFLKRVYQESVTAGDLYIAIDRALEALPGDHDSFNEAYADFALAMYAKSFVWGRADGSEPRDWGTYLPAARREPMQQPGAAGAAVATADSDVALRGIRFFRVPFASEPLLTTYAGDNALNARWAWTTPGGTMARPAGALYVVEDGPVSEVNLVLVRGPSVGTDPTQRVFGAGKFRAAVAAPGALLP